MIVCVTGPMAAGKNAACEILEELGFVSIDADITVRTVDKLNESYETLQFTRQLKIQKI